MNDPILDEIWRVREQLIKDHGGLDGYLRYIQKLDLDDRRRQRNRKLAATPRLKVGSKTEEKPSNPTMADPILEEIWRVRAQLLKDHGGWDGYDRYLQKLDAEHRRLERRRKLAAKARRAKQQQSTTKPGNSRPKRKSVA